jgi:nucleotide-binding universal stress UspA family protein
LHAGHRPFLISRPLLWGKSSMFKSILAVSEGGPDAAMSFKLAARVAGIFDGTVDALHLPVGPAGGMAGGLAMSGEAMPLIMDLDDERLEERATESERAYKEIVAPVKGATYTAAKTATLDTLVAMGRCADLLVLGRPGADPENVAPATVEAAVHECARAIMIAPPTAGEGPFGSVIVAWNGSFQAARAVEYSLPFLAEASLITILVVGSTPDDVGAPYLARNLGRHGLKTTIDAIDPGAVSGRARGRALLDYTHGKGADLLVMGAYGRGQVLSFLGFGGATGKVISSCRVPLLMAH